MPYLGVLPKAESEMRASMQVVYLGNDPRGQEWGTSGCKKGKERNHQTNTFSIELVTYIGNYYLISQDLLSSI